MKRLLVITLGAGLLIGGCREQGAANERPERIRTEAVAVRPASDFQQSVQAVLEDADRQIDELSGRVQGRWDVRAAEWEAALKRVRHRHTALRRDVQQLERTGTVPDSVLQSGVRRRLSGLQRDLEIARLQTIRTRRGFENAIQSHVEGVDTHIEMLHRQLRVAGRPVRVAYRRPVARLERRHERLKQKLIVLPAASRDEFGEMRRQMVWEAASLRADVRQLAHEVGRLAGARPES